MKSLIIFLSGKGIVLEAILKSKVANIKLVIYMDENVKDIIERYAIKGFRADYLNGREKAEEEIIKAIDSVGKADFYFLAGYNRLLSKKLLEYLNNRVYNLHLAYAEYFKGYLEYPQLFEKYKSMMKKKKLTNLICGPVILQVTEGIDEGVCVIYGGFKLFVEDTFEKFHKEMKEEEIKVSIAALRLLINPELESRTAGTISYQGLPSDPYEKSDVIRKFIAK
jgi:folate-dependent phosphoribosylglycinamide formyltransferase PurN